MAAEQFTHLGLRQHLLAVLTRKQHELPAAQAVGQAQADVGSLGLAVQGGVGRIQRVLVALDDDPLARVGLAVERDAQQALAHRAAAAVGAHDEAGAHRALAALSRTQRGLHALGVLHKGHQLGAQFQCHAGESR